MKKEYKDPIYKDPLVSKTINIFMRKGKKSKVEHIIYETLKTIKIRYKENPVLFFRKAVDNIRPNVELKTIRLSGTRYQIPFELNTSKQLNTAIRWLHEAVSQRSEKKIKSRLLMEIADAYEQKGIAYKKKELIHKKAVANRTLMHYRW